MRVWGILPTDASTEELTAAVRALSQGLIVGTSTLLFDSESEGGPTSHGPLTDRESEVLGLLAKGLANKQIAVSLGISEHTVKFHVSSIYSKLNVTNRTEAVREGLRGRPHVDMQRTAGRPSAASVGVVASTIDRCSKFTDSPA